MRALRPALVVLCCGWLAAARAQEAPPQRGREAPAPDLDFLEYLGTWAEGDDEWLAIEEWRKDNTADADDDKEVEGVKEAESERDDDDESE
jgi:hypothetical protein